MKILTEQPKFSNSKIMNENETKSKKNLNINTSPSISFDIPRKISENYKNSALINHPLSNYLNSISLEKISPSSYYQRKKSYRANRPLLFHSEQFFKKKKKYSAENVLNSILKKTKNYENIENLSEKSTMFEDKYRILLKEKDEEISSWKEKCEHLYEHYKLIENKEKNKHLG